MLMNKMKAIRMALSLIVIISMVISNSAYTIADENGGGATVIPVFLYHPEVYPLPLRVRLALDCIQYCSRHMPKFHAYVEDTYFFSEDRSHTG